MSWSSDARRSGDQRDARRRSAGGRCARLGSLADLHEAFGFPEVGRHVATGAGGTSSSGKTMSCVGERAPRQACPAGEPVCCLPFPGAVQGRGAVDEPRWVLFSQPVGLRLLFLRAVARHWRVAELLVRRVAFELEEYAAPAGRATRARCVRERATLAPKDELASVGLADVARADEPDTQRRRARKTLERFVHARPEVAGGDRRTHTAISLNQTMRPAGGAVHTIVRQNSSPLLVRTP
ncbi:hypothetical protein GQR58_029732 [Nymphon striatum]|nr:hypothetical protein GQR58_029732 [Nymphon striatum]